MALLDRVLLRERPPQNVEESRMTVIEHLEALRRALIISIIAWGLATLVSLIFASRIFDLLLARGGIPHAYFSAPTGFFMLMLKIALYLGFIVAFPVIVQQAWWFVSPGLHAHEKRVILPVIGGSIVFFLVGVGFAMFSLPLIIKVVTLYFTPANVQYFPFVDDYFSFVLALAIGYGLVFEMPVVVYVLGTLRIISSRWLYKNRVYWFLGLGLLANFLTPGGDPFTPMIMFVPLYLLWELTVLILKLRGR
jgi:sec-independent protein translocase protein TatC